MQVYQILEHGCDSDVVPMYAAHMLLGRPWQYDRKVNHDGFKNRYSLTMDGKKV